jgi:hypothetical protein
MRFAFDRITRVFTAPLHPPAVFLVSRTRLGAVLRAGRDGRFGLSLRPSGEGRLASQAVIPLPPGAVEPAFDKRNVAQPAALERAVREAAARLGRTGGPAGLMLPEACLKVFVLPFEGLPSSLREREEVLRWRLAKLAPLPAAETRMSFVVVKAAGQTRVVLALARADVVREYEEAFRKAGFAVREVGVPALNLLSLTSGAGVRAAAMGQGKMPAAGHALVVNLEEDHVSLTALLDGRAALYRFKPFLRDPAGPSAIEAKAAQAAVEIETTIRFLEDREKKTITTVWVRADVAAPEAAVAALRERLPALSVREPDFPATVRPPDRHFLAPLAGQVMP